MSILASIPGVIASTLNSEMADATLSKYGAKVSDGRGGRTAGSATAHDCRAIMLDYSDFTRGASGGSIKISDRKALVIATTLSVVPAIGDGFTLEGEWTVINVGRDPAAATYELQLRPGAPV